MYLVVVILSASKLFHYEKLSSFTFSIKCKDDLRAKLIDPPAEGAQDTDTRVLDAYIQQCTAEAQESKLLFILISITASLLAY